MKAVRYGIIGCGEVSTFSADSIDKSRNSRVIMFMDTKESLAKDLAEKHKAAYTTSIDELLSNPNIDAVYIAVPHHLHLPVAMKAAHAKKHMLLEKPISVSVRDSKKIISAAKRNGVRLSMAMIMRHLPAVAQIKKLVEKGVIGDLTGLHIPLFYEAPEEYWKGGWSGRVKSNWRQKFATSGGGVFIMNVFHFLDKWLYTTGLQPKKVFSQYETFAARYEVENYINTTLQFKNGALGSIIATSVARGGFPPEAPNVERLIGTEGQIVYVHAPQPHIYLYTRKKLRGYASNTWKTFEVKSNTKLGPRDLLFKEFSGAVLQNKPAPIPADEVLMTQKVCEAAYGSQKEDKPVRIR
jgi:predicted dehydrogenase